MDNEWICTLKDSNGITTKLSVLYPSKLLFDMVYIAIKNERCPLPTNVFCQATKSDLQIPLIETWRSGKNEIFLYGLLKRNLYEEPYYEVTCFRKTDIIIKEQTQEDVTIEMASGEKAILPVHSNCKTYIDAKIERKIPPKYIIRHDSLYFLPVEHVIFINFCGKLFIGVVSVKLLEYVIPMNIPSATNVLCVVFTTVSQPNENESENKSSGSIHISKTTASSPQLTFKTYLDKEDVRDLFFLALKYGARVGQPYLRPIRFLYRNKPDHYFNHIKIQRNGIMEPYIKNQGGEPGSVINGRIKGLFFSTSVDPNTNMPYEYSYFGNIRFHIEASYLFNPRCKLYFADFYCHNKRHHVTLVLCPDSFSTNDLCRDYLFQLDIHRNPYFKLLSSYDGSFCVLADMNVIVEIFYTDAIDIQSILNLGIRFMRRTPTLGLGYALPSGKPKNSSCDKCNLYRL